MQTTHATGLPAPIPLPLAPPEARRALKKLLAGTCWCREADSVVLAVHEALVNADRHGGGALRLQASIDDGVLVVVVCDRGSGFEIPRATVPDEGVDPFSENGRGLHLIRGIASRAETGWDGGSFCLRMRFDPPGARARR